MDAPPAFRRQLLDVIPRLRRYARTLSFDPAAADDLSQQTLERALVHWRQFDPLRDMAVWVLSIAHNAHLDLVRREARMTVTDPGELQRLQDANQPEQGGHAQGHPYGHPYGHYPGLRLDLEAALAQLPAEQRQPLLLVCVEQLSYAEVAEVLRIPVGTVMSRVCRGRASLRRFLEGPLDGQAPARTPLKRVV